MKAATPDISRNWIGSKVDSIFETFAPGVYLSRMKARAAATKFRLRAAQPSADREIARRGPHPNSALTMRDAVTLMFEARDLSENVGFVKGHLRKVQLYGAGTLSYEPETGEAGMDSEIHGFMENFNATAHVGGEHTLTRLIQLALVGMTRDRDSLLVFCRDDDNSLKLQLVEADQIGELFSFVNRENYIQGIYMDGPRRAGYHIYDRIGDLQYANGQIIPSHDGVFFYDPLRASVRGITAYETSIQNIRDKFEILGYEKIIVKDISTRGVITYTQTGRADEFDYDDTQTGADGNVSFIQHKESGVQEYRGVGERFEVVQHNRPSPTFQGFIKTLDLEDCQGLNLPYGFLVDPSDVGGASVRLIAHVANREFERIRNDILTPNLNRIRTIALADAMERRLISRHKNFRNGFWMFPPPPTADIQRESDISIREVRSGLSTRTGEWAMQGGSFRKKVKILAAEAIARRVAAAEATKELARLGYPEQVVLPDEIYANSDNPSQDPANADTTAKLPTASDALVPSSSASVAKPVAP